MRIKLTTEFVRTLPLQDVDIYDTKYPGLVLRCRASGSHSYRISYGRGKWVTLGRVKVLTVDQARAKARDELSAISKGHDPRAAREQKKNDLTFKAFLDRHYEPWALEHQKRGAETVQRFRSVFADLLDDKLSTLTAWRIEKWRTARLKGTGGKKPKPATVNSHLVMLKSAFNKAVAWKLLTMHPLKDVKALKTDKAGRIRYLTADEEKRLRVALDARDQRRHDTRERSNTWRRERGYTEYPTENPDHLTPIVKVAINTGLRKGEIFGMRWTDVDLNGAQITVRGEGAKSGQTRYIPLNAEVLTVLKEWRDATKDHDGFVFVGRSDSTDGRLDDIKKAWLPLVKAAKLDSAFRFHDLRHTFASKLVMAGVDLNTVRELLGHADVKMTLRYAHLAPEHKAAAVAKLVNA
jgi:integrase